MGFSESENGTSNMVMPVQPMGGYGSAYQQAPMMYPYPVYGGGYGGSNDNNDWLILFIILAMGGNWGGFGGFGGAGMAMSAAGMMDGVMMWPWLMSQSVDSDVQDGFNHASTQRNIEGLRDTVGNGNYSGEGSSGNYSGNYSGRYSGDNRHEHMLSQLERLAGEAENEHARKILTDAANRLRQ